MSDAIMTSIGDILATLGINTSRFYADWTQDTRAISNWVEEGSLQTVTLECHQPDGVVRPAFDFEVNYTAGGIGDAKFTLDNAAVQKYAAKIASVPVGTTYRLVCSFRAGSNRTKQPGWEPGARASTAHLRTRTIGTVAGAPGATATARAHL